MFMSRRPKEYTSTDSSYTSPLVISGAQKMGVPTAVIARSSILLARDAPKSVTLPRKKSVTRTLSGLRSLCRIHSLNSSEASSK
eukprot:CAMPEP_0114354378 /NCGR_PEP_ID=MMETSP0101-20121206/19410_1 /TAXON_ID=38822 ORGANISM="Pteridomonas danica, Strain PT" /NCGR_SAMPLE_ID=MMETSP0101 /ASSEMBLY_ACC=CAM_ASM_000211 /LENGTH=83 /DNA_ID=CAMNT_0001495767 /DNA_START=692 /DNA_END=943 /DNA_ORIENTATION=+